MRLHLADSVLDCLKYGALFCHRAAIFMQTKMPQSQFPFCCGVLSPGLVSIQVLGMDDGDFKVNPILMIQVSIAWIKFGL